MNKFMGDRKAIFIFVVPALLLYVMIVFVPIAFSSYYSLFDWDGFGEQIFTGLKNYVSLFVNPQDFFLLSLKNSIILAFLSVFVQLPISLCLALVISSKIKGEGAFRSIYFIPVIISTTVLGQLWMKIYHPNVGALNVLLNMVGLSNWTRAWLGEPTSALGATFFVVIWQYIGYHMLLMYSGIKAIPKDLFEAASIDGASATQTARHLTIPLIMPMIKVCVTFAIIGSLKTFDLVYVLTRGGPTHLTEVPSTLMYNNIIHQNRYGFGSSMAIFILLECLIFTVMLQRLFKVEDYEY